MIKKYVITLIHKKMLAAVNTLDESFSVFSGYVIKCSADLTRPNQRCFMICT